MIAISAIYDLIKQRQLMQRRTDIEDIQSFADKNKLPRADMGYALTYLKRTQQITFNPNYGYYIQNRR